MPDAGMEEGIGKVVGVVINETISGLNDMLDTMSEIVAVVMRSSIKLDMLEFEGPMCGGTVTPSFEAKGAMVMCSVTGSVQMKQVSRSSI